MAFRISKDVRFSASHQTLQSDGTREPLHGHNYRVRVHVEARELDAQQRVGFFRDVLGPLARGIPLGVSFIRIVDGVDLNDPLEAAEGRPVFELLPAGSSSRKRSIDLAQ